MRFFCWLLGHHEVTDYEYPCAIHPIPRAFITCSRCHKRISEETLERARYRASEAFQILMGEDDR